MHARIGMLCPLLAIVGSICFGVLNFKDGFFLSRTELPLASHCEDLRASGHAELRMIESQRDSQCWGKPRFKKLVLLLVDALRYDFVRDVVSEPHDNEEGLPDVLRENTPQSKLHPYESPVDSQSPGKLRGSAQAAGGSSTRNSQQTEYHNHMPRLQKILKE